MYNELDKGGFKVKEMRGFKKNRRMDVEWKDMKRRKELCQFWNQGWCKYKVSECKFLHKRFS